jgi:hypothetical protein
VPLIDQAYFRRAVHNIATWGDTDVFPFPVENHVFHDKTEATVSLLSTMCRDFDSTLTQQPPINYSALSPVGYNGFRWATQIDPLWNAYFLGAVLSLAGQIEERRVSESEGIVFSHRYRPVEDSQAGDADQSLFDREGWSKFQETSRELASAVEYVVAVDVADFYGRIYHHRLENQLRYIDTGGGLTQQIMHILGAFSNGVSYGLPVGGPAARILSEVLLDAVDQLILSQLQGIRFIRYADDYRFFVDNMEDAYRVIGYLSEKLQRNEGLSLQRSKTRIMTAAEYQSTLRPDDPRPGSAAKFLSLHLHFDPYSPNAVEDYEQLQDQLDEFDVLGLLRSELIKGRVDIALTRRLIDALKLMPETPKEQALLSLLDNLEVLAPVIPHVMRAVRANLSSVSKPAQLEIHRRVRDLVTSKDHLAQVDVNLSYMVRVLAERKSPENERLLIALYPGPHGYSQAAAPDIQRDIVLTLAKWGANYWLHDIKNQFATSHSWVRRAFIIASYCMGDEGSHWRTAVKRNLTDFERLVLTWASEKTQDRGWVIPI